MYIGEFAFNACYMLQSINMPKVVKIENQAMGNLHSLVSIDLPSATYIGPHALAYNYQLVSLRIPKVQKICQGAFKVSNRFVSGRIFDFSECESVPVLENSDAFTYNNIPVIRVPAALYDEWIAATNWSTYADYIVAV